ncbi:hypothetical protein [Noviherbaspirillum aridicola]|uniref:Uncharacterized protein n=1 Tax=Noviherbaspirillum aridicola TaxID=2849687 RepID=A0ABQ4Q1H7_9BURK|nr:hypothetical protein [Noviherbaspirillum aridicola]GIZ50912.1 hypothetical protein NCCP691_09260 [Noviherbaspirillum aridicola]
MKANTPTRADGIAALLIVLYILLLAAIPALRPVAEVKALFSEEGPFEMLSIVSWIVAAVVMLAAFREEKRGALLFGLLFVLFAAREADWHKKFTADSLLKSNYYRHTEAPLMEKLLAFAVALAFIALVLYVGFVIARFLLARGGWRTRGGLWLLAGTALVVLGKLLDRAPAELALAGHALSESVGLYAGVFEEGLEMIHPLILAWSLWLCRGLPLFGRAGFSRR